MTDAGRQDRSILRAIAHRVMTQRGLAPDFPPPALAELDAVHGPATRADAATRDLRKLPWCSIDNDDSRDLDQLTVAEGHARGCRQGPGRDCRRRRGRQEGLGARRSRAAEHHLGLHGCRGVPDAAREAVHGSHLAQSGVRPPGGRRRTGARRGRIAAGLGRLWSDGPQPGQAGVRQRGRLAGGSRADADRDRYGRRSRREPPPAGPRGPAAEGAPARARGARARDDRGASGLRRRRAD